MISFHLTPSLPSSLHPSTHTFSLGCQPERLTRMRRLPLQLRRAILAQAMCGGPHQEALMHAPEGAHTARWLPRTTWSVPTLKAAHQP